MYQKNQEITEPILINKKYSILFFVSIVFTIQISAQGHVFRTQNSTPVNSYLMDGLSPSKASTSAYKIKQDFPNSADGIYWIKNVNTVLFFNRFCHYTFWIVN